jgi:hypothetical protein
MAKQHSLEEIKAKYGRLIISQYANNHCLAICSPDSEYEGSPVSAFLGHA